MPRPRKKTPEVNTFNRGMRRNGQTIPPEPKWKPANHFLVPEGILISAFRYALGRRSYIVEEVASELRAHAPTMRPATRKLIAEEIIEAQEHDALGSASDAAEWMRAHKVLTEGFEDLAE